MQAAVERLRREGKRFDLFDTEDVAALLARLSAAEQEREQARDEALRLHKALSEEIGRATAAQARAEAAEQALRFYAKADNWFAHERDFHTDWILDCPATVEGPWWLARAALSLREETT